MLKESENMHEATLADALNLAAENGVDVSEVLKLIPEKIRPKVDAVLSGLAGGLAKMYASHAIKIDKPVDVDGLVEVLNLEKGYTDAMETQKVFQLLKSDESAPDYEQVLRTFTPKMLVVAQSFQEPTLILTTKGRSFYDLVAAMDGHKTLSDQKDVYVGGSFDYEGDLKLEHWSAYIADGTPDMSAIPYWDDESLWEVERFFRFARYKELTDLSGMDRWKYAQLMMLSLKKDYPLDSDAFTLLDEDPLVEMESGLQLYIPRGFCDNNGVYFEGTAGDDGGSFRRSVGGVVPME